MLIGFILGVCLMSLSAIFAIIMAEDGKDTAAIILAGPVMWVWIIVGRTAYAIYKKTALYLIRKNYLRYQIYDHGHLNDTYYIHRNVADFFYTKDENHNDYYVVFISDCANVKSLPFKQRKVTPRGIGRKYHLTENYLCKYIRPYTSLYRKMYHGD